MEGNTPNLHNKGKQVTFNHTNYANRSGDFGIRTMMPPKHYRERKDMPEPKKDDDLLYGIPREHILGSSPVGLALDPRLDMEGLSKLGGCAPPMEDPEEWQRVMSLLAAYEIKSRGLV